MGRFDALTELDEKEPQNQEQGSLAQLPIPPLGDTVPVLPTPQKEKKSSTNGKKPTGRQTSKSINALQLKQDKFDKYSTYLRPGYKKELKSIALERDCKDYEVLDEALTAFFEARKK
jgi:hypothetical protein